MKEAIHNYESDIICPHCGYVERNSWEYSEESDTIDCPECGEPFEYQRHVEVTYSTYLPTCNTPEDHDWVLETARRSTENYVGGEWVSKPVEEHKPYLVFECSKCKEQNYVRDVSDEEYEKALVKLLKEQAHEGRCFINKDKYGRYHASNVEVTQNILNQYEHELNSPHNLN